MVGDLRAGLDSAHRAGGDQGRLPGRNATRPQRGSAASAAGQADGRSAAAGPADRRTLCSFVRSAQARRHSRPRQRPLDRRAGAGARLSADHTRPALREDSPTPTPRRGLKPGFSLPIRAQQPAFAPCAILEIQPQKAPGMFAYSQNDYYCERVPLADLAHRVGTPAYVYSSQAIRQNYAAYAQAFGTLPHTVCYAVKANSSLAVLALLAKEGAGFDIVSGGELYRVLAAGGDPAKIVFSGVGKTAAEVEYALGSGIHTFNCESEAELALIDAKASRLGRTAGFSIRVNPDVDAVTHPYISTGLSQHKFGIAIAGAAAVYNRSRQFRNLVAEGVSCHIGSQILDPSPILEAVDKVLALARELRAAGHPIRHLDLGGGLGVGYHAGEKSPQIRAFVETLSSKLHSSGLTAIIEPGRSED